MSQPQSALTPDPSPTSRERGEKRASRSPKKWPLASDQIKAAARGLRKQPTRSERMLWNALRDRNLNGYKFRRQHPIGPFVLDFYCDEYRLAVEVDGRIHELTREADLQRQQTLESLGVRFLRVSAEQVERDLDTVRDSILSALDPGKTDRPSPVKRERGGGEGK